MNLVSLFSGTLVIIAEISLVVSQKSSWPANVALGRKNLSSRSNACADITWEPDYDPDGTFASVQCKGEEDDGRCFCFSPNGSRIFGWSWLSSRKNMNCRCSRHRHRLKTQLGRNDVSLHCSQNGNYEKLQCDNGLCWCVEPTTGEPNERLYPQSMMQHLPCYTEKSKEVDEEDKKEEKHPPHKYLRKCESKALARLSILEKLVAHGRINTHIDEALCDDDGSYAKLKIEKKNVYCVWKDSKKIANYQTELSNVNLMDCNCARDLMIYQEENIEMPMSCQGNGNYESSQTSNGRPYCVDKDGFATTELCDFGTNLQCPR